MSDCEHENLVYAYCLACELAKREKLIISVQADLSKPKEQAERYRCALKEIVNHRNELSRACDGIMSQDCVDAMEQIASAALNQEGAGKEPL